MHISKKAYFSFWMVKLFVFVILFLFLIEKSEAQVDGISFENKSPASISINRERGLNMLDEIKSTLKERYYDQNYRGIDLNSHFKTAANKIKTLETNSQIFRTLGQVLLDFKDSHTLFYPPNRYNGVEYGFSMQMIGNSCHVVDVKKGSDAEKKGLKLGDLLVQVGRYEPTRETFWILDYILYAIDPQPEITVIRKEADGKETTIPINSSFTTPEERRKKRETEKKKKLDKPYKCQEISSDLIACKLYSFSVEKNIIDKMMNEVFKYKKLILDLRGNGGGYVKTELYLLSCFFDHDIKVGTEKNRKTSLERIAKTNKAKVFNGELSVLIDSDSYSASEVFARVVQIEKRGKIIGDKSGGKVMTSIYVPMINRRGVSDFQTFSIFAMNVTVGDLVMSDGNRLEDIGVMPDYPVGPTGYAINKKYDSILAYAANLQGVKISDEKAGSFYFLVQKPENEEPNEREGEK